MPTQPNAASMASADDFMMSFQDVTTETHRLKFERAWGRDIIPKDGWHLTEMIQAMETKELSALYVIGENPAQSDADVTHVTHLLENLDHLVVQEIFLTKTAQLADVVLPATATWAEGEGTVTNSERRVQRCRKAVEPPGEARDEIWIGLAENGGDPTQDGCAFHVTGLASLFAEFKANGLQKDVPDFGVEDHGDGHRRREDGQGQRHRA